MDHKREHRTPPTSKGHGSGWTTTQGEPIPENYDRFIGLLRVVSRRHIPRGCRTNYIPGLTEESQSLYESYKKQYSSNPFAEGTLETG